MKIDFTQVLKNLKGEPIKRTNMDLFLDLEHACTTALLGTYTDEQKLSGGDKVKRFGLALKISNNPKEVDLKTEDVAEIKKLVGKAWAPLVVGRAYDMLEGDKPEEKVAEKS